ncbi:MAG: multicopper oxidase domain-containing protein [Nocardioidaceae bacterium]
MSHPVTNPGNDSTGLEATSLRSGFDRRRFLQLAGGAAAACSFTWAGKILLPEPASGVAGVPDLYIGGTDGWMHLPDTPTIPPFHPDSLAPGPMTTYIFGFRNLSHPKFISDATLRHNQKNHAQHSAPLFWVDQFNPAVPKDFNITLTNLGLALRPDLFDAHTLHWHGFRNVIPFFDGEPSGSISVPHGREFTYAYRPRDPGTYMYHCHVEDVEHVHMGMTGLVFVRPLQNGQAHGGFTKFMYNDGDGSTGYHREFAMFLSEVWAEAHWADAHIQLPEWSDYRADFALLNGRVYPDTVAPNAPTQGPSVNAIDFETDAAGYLVPPPGAGNEKLQNQPQSSLVRCNEGERVALRFANLGFRESAMTITGIRMKVVGRDATPMVGRNGTGDTSYETDTLNIGPGESYDVVFTAPSYVGTGPNPYDTYMLYNRNFQRSNNLAPGGFGGQATEIRVYPGTTVGTQNFPNDWAV